MYICQSSIYAKRIGNDLANNWPVYRAERISNMLSCNHDHLPLYTMYINAHVNTQTICLLSNGAASARLIPPDTLNGRTYDISLYVRSPSPFHQTTTGFEIQEDDPIIIHHNTQKMLHGHWEKRRAMCRIPRVSTCQTLRECGYREHAQGVHVNEMPFRRLCDVKGRGAGDA